MGLDGMVGGYFGGSVRKGYVFAACALAAFIRVAIRVCKVQAIRGPKS